MGDASRPDETTRPQGDVGADPALPLCIERIVREHHQRVYAYAFRLAGNQADAEDLTQQTYLIAQQKLHQVRDVTKVRSWLFAVLRSCFLKQRDKRVPTPAVNLELDVDLIPAFESINTTIDSRELQDSLDQLPDDFKVILMLFYFERFSYREIAEQLDLPIGTVMSRLSRAKSRLRQYLASEQTSLP